MGFPTWSGSPSCHAGTALHLQEPALYTGSYVHDRFPDASECSFAVGFKGPGATDADSVPLAVVQQLLGECWVLPCTLNIGNSSSGLSQQAYCLNTALPVLCWFRLLGQEGWRSRQARGQPPGADGNSGGPGRLDVCVQPQLPRLRPVRRVRSHRQVGHGSQGSNGSP